jgi:hypothetical protein
VEQFAKAEYWQNKFLKVRRYPFEIIKLSDAITALTFSQRLTKRAGSQLHKLFAECYGAFPGHFGWYV